MPNAIEVILICLVAQAAVTDLAVEPGITLETLVRQALRAMPR